MVNFKMPPNFKFKILCDESVLENFIDLQTYKQFSTSPVLEHVWLVGDFSLLESYSNMQFEYSAHP